MTQAIEKIVGPRIPREELRRHAGRYLLPTVLLILAAGLLSFSFTQPYWAMTLHAPQYPKGLHVQAYLNRLTGDVHEIDGLNHYIGMRPLNDAAQLERETSGMMIGVVAGLLAAAVFIHSRWAAVAALPALLFPLGFLADLQYWLASFGTNLDPRAALSSSIKPFVPPVLGVGTIGQFKTIATAGPGLWLSVAAAAVVLAALYLHRRAYKPLADLRARQGSGGAKGAAAVAALGLCCLPMARADYGADLQARIAAAPSGSTLVIPPGEYGGPIVVDKPLTLVAGGAVTIDAGGVGDAVRITAPDVTLRGLTIRGTGDSLDQQHAGVSVSAARATIENNQLEDVLLGVLLNGAADSVVRGNIIRGKALDLSRRGDGIRLWSSDGALVENNRVLAVRDVVVWYSQRVRLIDNEVRDSRYGMHFMYASGGVLERNRLAENSVGLFLMYSHDVRLSGNIFERNRGPSGYGLGLKDVDAVTAVENRFIGNRVGMYVDNSPSRTDVSQEFRRNVFAFNDVALAFLPAVQRNRFVENEFHENLEQVAILGSGELKNNDFTVDGRGNHWSDYAGYDADGDGRGDVPYHAMSLFENLMDREPTLRLFLHSPAQQAIELASRAFPVVRPRAKITDTAPLMQPLNGAQAGTGSYLPAILMTALMGGPWLALRRARGEPAADGRTGSRDGTVASNREPELVAAGALPEYVPRPPVDCLCTAPKMFELRGLRKRFGRQVAVDGVSLSVTQGQAVALWGTNGAGKTTIIKCILGLHSYRGDIRIAGHDARRMGKAARRLIGYVSQELSFHDDLSALETTRFMAALKRVPASRAGEVLERVGLGEHAGKRVAELSGGMKQRLALAVALLADPPALLLDEPTSNLDAAARRSFFDLLAGLKRAGKTIVFTTHRADEVKALADQVVELERGRVLRGRTPAGFGGDCQMRIPLPAEQRASGYELLQAAGFDVRRNCTALLVRVPEHCNARPLACLARAGIAVETFEIETGEDT